jgi:hypothetical protein
MSVVSIQLGPPKALERCSVEARQKRADKEEERRAVYGGRVRPRILQVRNCEGFDSMRGEWQPQSNKRRLAVEIRHRVCVEMKGSSLAKSEIEYLFE